MCIYTHVHIHYIYYILLHILYHTVYIPYYTLCILYTIYLQYIYYIYNFFIELLTEALKSHMKCINLRCTKKHIADAKKKMNIERVIDVEDRPRKLDNYTVLLGKETQ